MWTFELPYIQQSRRLLFILQEAIKSNDGPFPSLRPEARLAGLRLVDFISLSRCQTFNSRPLLSYRLHQLSATTPVLTNWASLSGRPVSYWASQPGSFHSFGSLLSLGRCYCVESFLAPSSTVNRLPSIALLCQYVGYLNPQFRQSRQSRNVDAEYPPYSEVPIVKPAPAATPISCRVPPTVVTLLCCELSRTAGI